MEVPLVGVEGCINPPQTCGQSAATPCVGCWTCGFSRKAGKQGQQVRLNAPHLPHTLELVGLTDSTYGRIWVGPFQMPGWFLTQHILLDEKVISS